MKKNFLSEKFKKYFSLNYIY